MGLILITNLLFYLAVRLITHLGNMISDGEAESGKAVVLTILIIVVFGVYGAVVVELAKNLI